MEIAKQQAGVEFPAAKSFSGLMELYEENYRRLRRLITDIEALEHRQLVSVVPGCQDLYCQLVEHSKYTTIIRLTYRLKVDDVQHLEPNLQIRVYHDARVAEVMSGVLKQQRLPAMAQNHQRVLQLKWKFNRFLYKWLNFCLKQGHQFDSHNLTAESDVQAIIKKIQQAQC